MRFDALVRSAEAQLHGARMAAGWETSGRRDADSVSIPDGAQKAETKPRRSGASLNGEGAALASCRLRRIAWL